MDVVGLAVLYTAFGVVALWLTGELLLQHRAEPHWRALALLGFLVLVAGVATGSLPLIGVGVVAFGAGQFLVTRSVRTTRRTHWSLRSADGGLPAAVPPVLAKVFPAGGPAAETGPPPVLVGEVGPIQEAEAPAPVAEPEPAYVYDGPGSFPQQDYSQQAYPQQDYYQQSYEYQPQQGYQQQGYGQQQYQPEYVEQGYYAPEPTPAPYYGYEQQQQPVAQEPVAQPQEQYQHSYDYQYLPQQPPRPPAEPPRYA